MARALDLRHAVRALRRRRGWTLAAVLTLGVAAGAGAAIGTVAWQTVVRPLPYERVDRLVILGDRRVAASGLSNMNIANFLDLRAASRTFEAMAAFEYGTFLVRGSGEPAWVRGMYVSAGFFDVLGRPPALGRGFLPEDDVPGARVAILSDALWRTRFGADPGIVGRTVQLDLEPWLVVGVAPPEFTWRAEPLLFVPWGWDDETRTDRRRRRIFAVARLADGTSMDAGLTELRALFDGIRTAYPEPNEGMTVTGRDLAEWSMGWGHRMVLLLGGAALLVLIVAGVNYALLLLARAESRRTEIEIRRALGAGRGRLVWASLSESLVVAALGALAGVLIAVPALAVLQAGVGTLPRAATVDPGAVTVAIAFGLALLGGAAAGGLAALVGPALARARSLRLRPALVVVEVAAGVVVVALAGLLLGTATRLARVDLGVERHGVLSFRLTLPPSRYDGDAAATFFERAVAELEGIPGVTAAGLSSRDPLNGGTNGTFRTPANEELVVEMRTVSAGWFDATGQRIEAGRGLREGDAADRAIVVNRALARRILPGTGSRAVLVRTTAEPLALLPIIRQRLVDLDPDIPVTAPATLDEMATRAIGTDRLAGLSLVGGFAILALVLAILGIYAVLAFDVEQRRREVGVRMALGATGARILRLVCGRALRLAGAGILLGAAGALLAGRLVEHLLWEVRPSDPMTLVATALVFLLVALIGAALPARRAARVEVTDALRAP